MDILSLSLNELTEQLELLKQPSFRAKQIFEWLHKKKVQNFSEMSNLPKRLRLELENVYYIQDLFAEKKQISTDGTEKYLFKLHDGNYIETVVMKYKSGTSVCISTQVGCRMGCNFCASTQNGLVRNLTTGEMLKQVYFTEREAGSPIDNIVLMGIGEPLDNFVNVVSFLQIITDENGRNFGQRNISLSTCGIVPGIDKLSEYHFGLTLSLSLHAPFDTLRTEMMPINNSYPLKEVLAACRRYQKKTGRRISFEYTVIPGINDSDDCAREIGTVLKGIIAHVNLIPLNHVNEAKFFAGKEQDLHAFAKKVESTGIEVTVRRKLGEDISAACGQLRAESI